MADEDKLLNSTKSLLRAVLAPKAKAGIPLHHLCQEFEETTLSDLNHKQFGYGSLEQFIRDIPDVCTIGRGIEGYLVVRGIPTKDDAHVYKLASGQRVSKKKSARTGRPKLHLSQVKRKASNFSSKKRSSPSYSNYNPRVSTFSFLGKSIAVTDAVPRFLSRTSNFSSSLPPRFQNRLPPRLSAGRNQMQGNFLSGNPNNSNSYMFQKKPSNNFPMKMVISNTANSNRQIEKPPLFQQVPTAEWSPQELSAFRKSLVKFLARYENGLMLSRFAAEYKRVYSKELPPNIGQILEKHYTDVIDINKSMPKWEIVYLKKNPVQPVPEQKDAIVAQEQTTKQQAVKQNGMTVPQSNQKSDITLSKVTTIPYMNVPEINGTKLVVVCHVETPSRFFIQFADTILEDLVDDMQIFYDEKALSSDYVIKVPSVGDFCCARYSEDRKWFRAKILSVKKQTNILNDSYRCNVIYVDYGNMEFVVSNELKLLHGDYANLPMQAVHCELNEILPPNEDGMWTEDIIKKFKEITDNNELTMKVIDKKDNLLSIDLFDNNRRSLIDYLVHTGSARKMHSKSIEKSQSSSSIASTSSLPDESSSQMSSMCSTLSLNDNEDVPVSWVQVPKDDYIDVFVVHVSSSQEISLILIGPNYNEKLDDLEQKMNNFYDNKDKSEGLENIEIGDYYVAFCATAWSRIQLLSISDNECEVLMLDYGKKTSVSYDDIQELIPKFRKLPFQSVKCTLSDVPLSYDPEILQYLTEVTVNQPRIAYIVKRPEEDEVNHIIELVDTSNELNDSCTNINKELKLKIEKEDNLLPQLAEVGEGFVQGYISHVSYTGEVYLQILGPGLEKLETIMEDMSSHFKQRTVGSEIISRPEIGMLCCAKFLQDGQWYRAQITKILENRKVEVHFIDYGNKEIIPNLYIRKPKAVSEKVLTLPFQAIKCELHGLVKDASSDTSTFEKMAWFIETYPVEIVNVEKTGQSGDTPLVKLTMHEESENETKPVDFLDKFNEILKTIDIDNSNVIDIENVSSTVDNNNVTPFVNISVVATESDEAKAQITKSFSDWDVIDTSIPNGKSIQNITVSSKEKKRPESPLTVLCKDTTIPQIMFHEKSIKAVVQDSIDPFKFSITPVDYWSQLEELHMMMFTHYKDSQRPRDFHPTEQSVCVAFHERDEIWYRAVVQTVIEEQCVVKYADFSSSVEVVNMRHIRPIIDTFKKLPFLAIQCKIGGIEPTSSDVVWNDEASNFFHVATINETFYAEILCDVENIDRNSQLPVNLHGQDESGNRFTISDLLVEKGYANLK